MSEFRRRLMMARDKVIFCDWISNNNTSSSIEIPIDNKFIRIDYKDEPTAYISSNVQKHTLHIQGSDGTLMIYAQNNNCYVWDTRYRSSLRVSSKYTGAINTWTMAYNASSTNKYVFGVDNSWASGSMHILDATSLVVFPYYEDSIYDHKVRELIVSDAYTQEVMMMLKPAKVGQRFGLHDVISGITYYADESNDHIIGGYD